MKRLAPLAILSLLGCSDPAVTSDAGVDPTPYELSLRGLDGADAGIEMRLGFQGFRYTRVVLVASGDVPASTPGSVRLEIEGFEPAAQRFRAIEFSERGAGRYESSPLLVYANDITLSRAVGRPATLSFELNDGRRRATASLRGPVRWDPNCVEDDDYRCLPPGTRVDGGAP